MLSGAQAADVGLARGAIRHRLAAGRWERVLPGVYRVAGSPRSWEQDLMAACLHAGPPSAASHRAAATLWGLEVAQPTVVEIVGPRRIRHPGVIAHRARVREESLTTVGPVPVTDPARTLLDLGAVAAPWIVGDALDAALRGQLVSLDCLRRLLQHDGARGRAGTGVLRSLVDARDPGAAPAESVLETRLARLLTDSSLPQPVRQHEVRVAGRVARIDFAWPEVMVAVEADGYRYHSGRRAWSRDLSRRNLLTGAGWRVLHVTWDDVRSRPEATLAAIRRALVGRRSWTSEALGQP